MHTRVHYEQVVCNHAYRASVAILVEDGDAEGAVWVSAADFHAIKGLNQTEASVPGTRLRRGMILEEGGTQK